MLSHGLSSNSLTWDPVATALHQAGYSVVTVDQRGHGLSSKPDHGYACADIAEDMVHLIQALGLDAPIFAGQSWGGNIALYLGAVFPDLVRGLGFIDGGFIDLQGTADADWETVRERLKPPNLSGCHIDDMRVRLRGFHPDWPAEGVEHTLGNFAVDAAGRIAPQLSLDNHLQILRGLWDMRPGEYYARVQCPVLICAAQTDGESEKTERKRVQTARAQTALAQASVTWFAHTDHDIHVHRPDRLAAVLLHEAEEGIWAAC